jgi:hypothetical protein
MRHKHVFFAVIAVMVFLAFGISHLEAQSTENIIAHKDIFGNLQRPPAIFSHDLHMDVFSNLGCGVCHHVVEENSGELVYRQGEEVTCKDCHGKEKKGRAPALREAYHGSCTACHRSAIANQQKSGPVTCGECHPKR